VLHNRVTTGGITACPAICSVWDVVWSLGTRCNCRRAVCTFRIATSGSITPRSSPQEQEPAPHIALDIPPVSKPAEQPHRRAPSDAAYGASEAGGDAGLALELEVLRSEEIAAGGAAGGDEDQVPDWPRACPHLPRDNCNYHTRSAAVCDM